MFNQAIRYRVFNGDEKITDRSIYIENGYLDNPNILRVELGELGALAIAELLTFPSTANLQVRPHALDPDGWIIDWEEGVLQHRIILTSTVWDTASEVVDWLDYRDNIRPGCFLASTYPLKEMS